MLIERSSSETINDERSTRRSDRRPQCWAGLVQYCVSGREQTSASRRKRSELHCVLSRRAVDGLKSRAPFVRSFVCARERR